MAEYIVSSERSRVPEAWFALNAERELVRCRDCVMSRIKYTKTGKLKTASCSWHGRCIDPGGYCAWGEWREAV